MTKEETKNKTEENKGKMLSGVVSSVKMTDTIVVDVTQYSKHAKYGKFMKTKKKYKVDDKGNTAKLGDKVDIVEVKPISKYKRFKLSAITTAAAIVDVTDDKE